MNWKMMYIKTYPRISKKKKEIGLKDWKQRSSIFLNWLEKYNPKKDLKILDCGCGRGIASQILKESGYINVIGIDIDKNALKYARGICSVREMDCQNFIFPPKTFDVVLALNIIEHLQNPRKFLIGVRKILKDDGILILSLPNTNFLRIFLGRTIAIPEHIHYWSYKAFKEFLENRHFKVLEMKPVGRFPFLLLCNTFMTLAKKAN